MTECIEPEGALRGYRVLDLAQSGYALCGKILGDLGADVIKIERPGGDAARCLGPFYGDVPHPERSLFWFYFNSSKRGITLNIETKDGRELFKKLVSTADFVIESFEPGYLEKLRIGYPQLSEINPRIIVVSITPYGQTGPKAGYVDSELSTWASSGSLNIMGEPDREPIGIGFPMQASLNAGSEAATAAMIALWDRETHGEGQHVDVSAQETCIAMTSYLPELWEGLGKDTKRVGPTWPTMIGVPRRMIYQCKDGFANFTVQGGTAGIKASMNAIVKWMREEGAAPEWLLKYNWQNDYDAISITLEGTQRLEAPFVEFLLTKTKKEINERATRDGILLVSVDSMKDVTENIQFKHLGFWEEVWHSELGTNVTYPGAFAILSETPCHIRRRAPLIGEHNEEIYVSELGLSAENLSLFKAIGAI